jgi:hypothetical protein
MATTTPVDDLISTVDATRPILELERQFRDLIKSDETKTLFHVTGELVVPSVFFDQRQIQGWHTQGELNDIRRKEGPQVKAKQVVRNAILLL